MAELTIPSIRRRMAQTFVAHLDAGRVPWTLPWGELPALPAHPHGPTYFGLNRLLTSLHLFAQQASGHPGSDVRFMTENVAHKLGGHLKDGAIAVPTERVHARMVWEQPGVRVDYAPPAPTFSRPLRPVRRGEVDTPSRAAPPRPVHVLRLVGDDKASVEWTLASGATQSDTVPLSTLQVTLPEGPTLPLPSALADPALNPVYTKGYLVYGATDFAGLDSVVSTRERLSQDQAQRQIMEAFDGLARHHGPRIVIGDRSFYNPQDDVLGVRSLEAFKHPAPYCESLLTGLALSCEHASRVGKPEGERSQTEVLLTAKLAVCDLAWQFGFNPSTESDPTLVERVKQMALEDPDALARASLQADKISNYVTEQLRSLRVEQDCRAQGVPYFYKDESDRLHVDDFATGTNLLDPENAARRTFLDPSSRGVFQTYSGLVYDLASQRFAVAQITPSATALTYLAAQTAEGAAQWMRQHPAPSRAARGFSEDLAPQSAWDEEPDDAAPLDTDRVPSSGWASSDGLELASGVN